MKFGRRWFLKALGIAPLAPVAAKMVEALPAAPVVADVLANTTSLFGINPETYALWSGETVVMGRSAINYSAILAAMNKHIDEPPEQVMILPQRVIDQLKIS